MNRSVLLLLALLGACAPLREHNEPEVNRGRAADIAVEADFDATKEFDHVWSTIQQKFVDPSFNGVDWNAARDRYRPAAAACRNEAALASVINEMLSLLRTSHTNYLTEDMPACYAVLASVDRASQIGRCGIGVDTVKVGDDYYVSGLLAGDEGERAGLRVGDRLISVDGKPFDPIGSFKGKSGQQVLVAIQRAVGEKSEVRTVVPTLMPERERYFQATLSAKVIEENGTKIGYIRLWWLADPKTQQYFPGLLKSLVAMRGVRGIILDLRDGYGGNFEPYLSPFFIPPFGEITKTARDQTKQEIPIGGIDVPLVVLINGGSRSGKELLPYYLRKSGRAVLVGERTAGFISVGRVERISGSAVLYYCGAKVDLDYVDLLFM